MVKKHDMIDDVVIEEDKKQLMVMKLRTATTVMAVMTIYIVTGIMTVKNSELQTKFAMNV